MGAVSEASCSLESRRSVALDSTPDEPFFASCLSDFQPARHTNLCSAKPSRVQKAFIANFKAKTSECTDATGIFMRLHGLASPAATLPCPMCVKIAAHQTPFNGMYW
jgi:hypothetical protein